MFVAAALLAGGALGARHALEGDHLAAVTTVDGEDRGAGRDDASSLWGLGLRPGIVVAGVGIPGWF